MSYEDEDAKSRRNLVVVSTLVLAGVWLKIPPGALVAKFAGLEPSQADDIAARIWFGVLAVLAYLVLRFKFSDLYTAAMAGLSEEFDAVRLRIISKYVQSQLTRFAIGKSAPIFGDQLIKRFMSRPLVLTQISREPNTAVARQIDGGQTRYDPKRRLGDVQVTIAEQYGGGGGSSGEEGSLGFSFPGKLHHWVNIRSAVQISIYSRAATAVLVPWALSALAVVVTVCRSVQALVEAAPQ